MVVVLVEALSTQNSADATAETKETVEDSKSFKVVFYKDGSRHAYNLDKDGNAQLGLDV